MLRIVSMLRANVKSVCGQAIIFAVAQASTFYFYGAGYYLSAFLVSNPDAVYHTTYDRVFR